MHPQGPFAASSDPLSAFETERRPLRAVPGPVTAAGAAPGRSTSDAAMAGARRITTAPPAAARATTGARACEPNVPSAASFANRRRSLLVFASGVVLGSAFTALLVLSIASVSQAFSQQPVAPRASSSSDATTLSGSLAIDTTPVAARAYVNGSFVGITPLVLTQVPVGSRVIRLEADDHAPWISTVRIVAYQQTRVAVTLSAAH